MGLRSLAPHVMRRSARSHTFAAPLAGLCLIGLQHQATPVLALSMDEASSATRQRTAEGRQAERTSACAS